MLPCHIYLASVKCPQQTHLQQTRDSRLVPCHRSSDDLLWWNKKQYLNIFPKKHQLQNLFLKQNTLQFRNSFRVSVFVPQMLLSRDVYLYRRKAVFCQRPIASIAGPCIIADIYECVVGTWAEGRGGTPGRSPGIQRSVCKSAGLERGSKAFDEINTVNKISLNIPSY